MPDFIYRNPWCRALIPLIMVTIVGVASSALVVEVSTAQVVDWTEMPKRISFYIIIFCCCLACLFQVKLYKRDNDLLKGFTPKQYEACIRNQIAEDVSKRSKKLIREGKIEQLEKETDAFKRLYGDKL